MAVFNGTITARWIVPKPPGSHLLHMVIGERIIREILALWIRPVQPREHSTDAALVGFQFFAAVSSLDVMMFPLNVQKGWQLPSLLMER